MRNHRRLVGAKRPHRRMLAAMFRVFHGGYPHQPEYEHHGCTVREESTPLFTLAIEELSGLAEPNPCLLCAGLDKPRVYIMILREVHG